MTSDFWFILIHGKIWATRRPKVPPPQESVPQLRASPTLSRQASWARGVCKLALLMTVTVEDTVRVLKTQKDADSQLPAAKQQPEPPPGACRVPRSC